MQEKRPSGRDQTLKLAQSTLVAQGSADASAAHGWLLEAKCEAMSLPSWEGLRRAVRDHVYAQLDAHGGQRYFSDLTAEARTVILKEAYQDLRRQPAFGAFGRDLALCVDNKLFAEAQGNCASDATQQRTVDELLRLAAEAGSAFLSKNKGAEDGLLRGLIGQRLPKVLRCELWRTLLVKREARGTFLVTSQDAGQPALELKVLERLQGLFAAHFPASNSATVMVAKQLAVTATLTTPAGKGVVAECSQWTLHAAVAVVLAFDGPQGPTLDPPELAERHAALLDLLEPLICLVRDERKQREVVKSVWRHIQSFDPELKAELENLTALSRLASVEDLLTALVVVNFWERLFIGALSAESSFFILDLFVLAGPEPSRVETVVVIATCTILLACSRRMVEFANQEGSTITEPTAAARLLVFAAADVSPVELEGQVGHFETELLSLVGAEQSSRRAEEEWLVGNPNPPPLSPRDDKAHQEKAVRVKANKSIVEQASRPRVPRKATSSASTPDSEGILEALRSLPEVPQLPVGADLGSVRWTSLTFQLHSKDVVLCLPPVVVAAHGACDTLVEITEACLRLRDNLRSLRSMGLEASDTELRQEVAAALRLRFPGLVEVPDDAAEVLEAYVGNVSVSVCVSKQTLSERGPSAVASLARAVRRLQLRDETLEAGLVASLLKKQFPSAEPKP